MLKAGVWTERAGVDSAHQACDKFCQIFREQMKKFNGQKCIEKHVFQETFEPEQKNVNLRGVMIVGTSDKYEDKYLCAERVAVSLECMQADGAVFSCNAIGNNHVDYAHVIEQTELRGIPVTALSLCPAKDFVNM